MKPATCQILRPAAFAKGNKGNNVFAVASGKGGVGKTWFAISLAHALAKSGKRTLLFDGDLGLANVDIQLGLMPRDDLGGVLAGRLSLPQAILPFEDGFDIIAGRSGSGRLAALPPSRIRVLTEDLIALAREYDFVVLDLGAGVEQTVRQLTRCVDCCLVIVTDEPTSLTDAYAFIKLSRLDEASGDFRIVVNMAATPLDGERTYATLHKVCEGFLKISPPLAGVIRRDTRVPEAIRNQASLLKRFPTSNAAADVQAIAMRLLNGGTPRTAGKPYG